MLHYDQVTSLPNKVKPGKPSQITFHQKCKIRTFCGYLLTFESLITTLHKKSVTEAEFLFSMLLL